MTPAGISAVASGAAMLVSGFCLVVFAVTEKEAWGRANDATSALFAALMIPSAFAIYERFAPGSRWTVGLPTLLGVAGMMAIAVTSGLTAAGKLDWLVSAKIGGVGLAAVTVWIGAVSGLIFLRGGLPEGLAWLGFVTVAIAIVGAVLTIRFIRANGSLIGDVRPPTALVAVFGLAYVCLPAWIVWLGIVL